MPTTSSPASTSRFFSVAPAGTPSAAASASIVGVPGVGTSLIGGCSVPSGGAATDGTTSTFAA
jgi:hypothetical protein